MLSAYSLDQDTAEDIIVYIETDGNGTVHPSIPGLLGLARKLSSGRLFGFMFEGRGGRDLYDGLYELGVDTVYHMRNPGVKGFQPMAFADAASALAERINPASILFSATSRGRELAPLIAAKLGAGLTADCTSITSDGRRLTMIRPALGGNIEASIVSDSFPQMATVRPEMHPDPEPVKGRKGTAIAWPYAVVMEREVVESKPVDAGEDITGAKVLISLGNGIRKRSSVDSAIELAGRIGASVSCTRAFADKGWLPRSAQVGQSGRTVSPDVYIAFGISGSVQHLAGLRAEKIISINRDANAPINGIADVAVIGDADSILESMLKRS